MFVLAVLLQPAVSSQTQAPARTPEFVRQRAEEFRRRSETADKAGLAAPFKGLTTNGVVEQELFAIRSTGVSTEPVRKAADAFLAALTPAQRTASTFAVDDGEWRKWMNQDFYFRQGVSFLDLKPAQRDAGIALMQAALSAGGLKQTRDIMRLNHTLGELNDNDFDRYGEWRYHITVMGKPSATEPWGWQLDGHHAIINYFVLGDQVVMSPLFAGSEPVTAHAGAFKGTTVLQDEQNRGVALVNALDAEQRKKAILKVSKTGNENLTDARVKMDEVRRFLDRTWFAWIGETDPDGVFYYRVHSPVILIEFDHQVPANLKQYAKDPNAPNHEHIHTVMRTPNGNDYGKDLLRLHYLQHPHGSSAQ